MNPRAIYEWYSFLDARSDDEAVCELRRLSGRLGAIYQQLEQCSRPLNYAPEAGVDEALRVARSSLSEAIDMLERVATRFRNGERHETA